ncbi:conserved hypothetical protein [Staphylococcus aureus]|uniref:Nitrogen regulation protein NIFR3 n=1 Tax=Staphylococcus aureus TaxID=1280 RepID=A0A0U1MRM5_STAAU|nr:conserved hypothetical protein [Staphylococcus aureus]
MQVGGAPTQKVTKSQLTIMCKLGNGAQHREFQKEILQTMQVGGAPTQKVTKSQLTIMCKLGNGAPT